jgi:hypothetical protein
MTRAQQSPGLSIGEFGEYVGSVSKCDKFILTISRSQSIGNTLQDKHGERQNTAGGSSPPSTSSKNAGLLIFDGNISCYALFALLSSAKLTSP